MTIRTHISIVEHYLSEGTVKLTDIYSDDELNDVSEVIHAYIDDDTISKEFTVRTLSAEEAKNLWTHRGDMSVIEAFKHFADKEQKTRVREKMKNFDPNRIVVLDGRKVLDGNHQVVAAILSDNEMKYIDIGD